MPRIIQEGTLTSTNTVLKEMIKENPNNFQDTVIIANEQTLGRGRNKRSFSSPEGGLYISMSFLANTFDYPTATAAVYTMLSINKLGKSTQIKWLNDLYYEGKKVCGILAEKIFDYIIIGIGINLTTKTKEFPKDIQYKTTSLFPGKTEMLNNLREKLSSSIIDFFYNQKNYDILSIYKKNCFTINREIIVNNFKETYKAKAIGINDKFELLILIDGKVKPLSTGEIILNPQLNLQ